MQECGERSTLQSIENAFQSWTDAGSKMKDAKKHGNVVHPPLLSGEPDQQVIEILPPPELHLMLGAVNTMFSGIY